MRMARNAGAKTPRAVRALARALALLLVAGIAPVLPEAPLALAEEPGRVFELGDGSAPGTDGAAGGVGSLAVIVRDGAVRGEDAEAVIMGELCGQGEVSEESGLELVGPVVSQDESSADDEGLEVVRDGPDEAGVLAQAAGVSVSGPRVKADSSMAAGQAATWDCVWFGSYPQSEVAPEDPEFPSVVDAAWNADGDATVGGKRYRRISGSDATSDYYWMSDGYGLAEYRYFRYEPVKWRVLGVSGDAALVISDVALDSQPYNANWEEVTWGTSGMRSWLNAYGPSFNQPGTDFTDKSFKGAAFSSNERSAILTTDLVTPDNTAYGTEGGDNTTDRVFLLSETEAYYTSYGLVGAYDTKDEARRCKASDYAHAMGAMRSSESGLDGNCYWWVRSPGQFVQSAAFVNYDGSVNRDGYRVYGGNIAVRPALTIDLSSPYLEAAGTVNSNGEVGQQVTTLARSITSVTLATTSYTYDGTAKRPAVTVSAGDEAVPTSGYDVSYGDNVKAGTATATVTGKDGYEGTLSATFKIKRASVAKAKVTGLKSRTYTGKAQAQSPTVKVGGRTLKKGTDYKLTYKNNVKAGKATVTIKGVGNYAGSVSEEFTIAKAANPMALKAVKRTAKASAAKKKAVVVAAPLKLTKKAQGKVTYARVAKGSSKCLAVDKSTGKVTVKKGTKKGTYKVKIKVTAKGNANYKALSKTITCTVVVK